MAVGRWRSSCDGTSSCFNLLLTARSQERSCTCMWGLRSMIASRKRSPGAIDSGSTSVARHPLMRLFRGVSTSKRGVAAAPSRTWHMRRRCVRSISCWSGACESTAWMRRSCGHRCPRPVRTASTAALSSAFSCGTACAWDCTPRAHQCRCPSRGVSCSRTSRRGPSRPRWRRSAETRTRRPSTSARAAAGSVAPPSGRASA
mmetsp:Transcript_123862/g.361678  ORF Transcript_123862/g.361678 Transcript_123862/m.361678 type:complete len:202 (-) Transcript_123862:970-1575(-)